MTSDPNNPDQPSSAAQERLKEEARIIAEVLEQTPASDRAVVKRDMERYFASVRNVDFASIPRELVHGPELRKGEKQRAVRVLVALVPSLGRENIKSTVVRRPGDAGQPLLLLRESDATDDDLRNGLRAAAVSYQRYGDSPSKEWKLSFRTTDRTRALPPRREGMRSPLEYLKTATSREIPGVGLAKAMYVSTRLPGKTKPKG